MWHSLSQVNSLDFSRADEVGDRGGALAPEEESSQTILLLLDFSLTPSVDFSMFTLRGLL